MISPQPNYGASNIIYIRGGLEGAKNYPVQPGYTAWLIDEENKQFFIKTIGPNGVPNVREFDYVERSSQMQASNEDSSKWVSKEDLDKLYRRIERLEKNSYKPNNYRRNGNGKQYDKPYGKSVQRV